MAGKKQTKATKSKYSVEKKAEVLNALHTTCNGNLSLASRIYTWWKRLPSTGAKPSKKHWKHLDLSLVLSVYIFKVYIIKCIYNLGLSFWFPFAGGGSIGVLQQAATPKSVSKVSYPMYFSSILSG